MLAAERQLHLHNIWSRNIFPINMEGCVLYAPFWQEDMQGSTLLSYDQYHNSMAVTGATWGIQGRSFDGLDNRISVSASPSINNLSAETFAVWVKWNGADFGEVNPFLLGKGAGGIFWYVSDTLPNYPITYYRDTSGTDMTYISSSPSGLTNGVWYFMVAKHSASLVGHILIDNVEVSYATATPGTGTLIDDSATNLTIGDIGDGTRVSNATFGEVFGWNRELLIPELAQVRQATKWRYQ